MAEEDAWEVRLPLSRNSRKTGTSRPREFLTLFRGTNVPFALLVMGEDAHVNAFGGADEAVEIAAEGAFPPTVAAAVADVNLGDAAEAGEAEDGVYGVFAIKLGDFGSFGAGGGQTFLDILPLIGRPIRAIEVNGDQFAVKTVTVACAAIEHALVIRSGR